MAGVGGWELDLVEGRLRWSKETCRIHDVEPDYEPQLDTAINFYAPDSQALIMAAVEKCIATGEGWDLELQLITARGKLLWVRAVGSAQNVSMVNTVLCSIFADSFAEMSKQIEGGKKPAEVAWLGLGLGLG